jgi:hypothetical protein
MHERVPLCRLPVTVNGAEHVLVLPGPAEEAAPEMDRVSRSDWQITYCSEAGRELHVDWSRVEAFSAGAGQEYTFAPDPAVAPRFAAAVTLLGSEVPVARLAGVSALAHLADEREDWQQRCVDALCGYFRRPLPEGPGAPAEREVRATIFRTIRRRLRQVFRFAWSDLPPSWSANEFDFSGAVFGGGSLAGSYFTGGVVSFDGATFAHGDIDLSATFEVDGVSFAGATFAGADVVFDMARFDWDCLISFTGARFLAGRVMFDYADVRGLLDLSGARFEGGTVDLRRLSSDSRRPDLPAGDPPPGLLLPSGA